MGSQTLSSKQPQRTVIRIQVTTDWHIERNSTNLGLSLEPTSLWWCCQSNLVKKNIHIAYRLFKIKNSNLLGTLSSAIALAGQWQQRYALQQAVGINTWRRGDILRLERWGCGCREPELCHQPLTAGDSYSLDTRWHQGPASQASLPNILPHGLQQAQVLQTCSFLRVTKNSKWNIFSDEQNFCHSDTAGPDWACEHTLLRRALCFAPRHWLFS